MVEISANGRVIGAANHPFLVLRDDGVEWLQVDSLRVGDFVAVAAPESDHWSTTDPTGGSSTNGQMTLVAPRLTLDFGPVDAIVA